MRRSALFALVVLACASAANARIHGAVGEVWTDSSSPSHQQAGPSVAAAAAVSAAAAPARQPAGSSNPGNVAQKPAAVSTSTTLRPASGVQPLQRSKPVTAAPRHATRPHAAPGSAATSQGPAPAARMPATQQRQQQATGSSSSSASRPAAAAPPAALQQATPPMVLRPPLGGSAEPMTHFSKDIRGLQLSIVNIKLNPTTLSPDGQSITGFTFAGDLLCMAAASMPIVGSCYISANVLADDDQAIATAICVTNTNAPNCDPQLDGALTITATGLLTVNMDSIAITTSSDTKAAAASRPVVKSFSTVTPLIVDGVYSSMRPDTLLGSILGFKRGSLDIPNVKRTDDGSYTGSITLSLFKGPVL